MAILHPSSPWLGQTVITSTDTLTMENLWVFDDTYSYGSVRQTATGNEQQERDRKERMFKVVSKFKIMLDRAYRPMIAKEYLSVLFRQRGVPSIDMFTSEIIGSVRQALGFPPNVDDTLRRILVLGKWTNLDCSVTMWMIEPVIATMIVHGNTVNAMSARENFSKEIKVIEPLTMTTHNTSVTQNVAKGRWAGWLVWKEYMKQGSGNPSCVMCNLCGSSIMFAIHRKGSRVFHMMLTPESVIMLSHYTRSMNAATGATSSLIASSSTRLKIQPGLDRARSTWLNLYGNGSMQFCGSPAEIGVLYTSLLEILMVTMNEEMVEFLKTMRRADSRIF